jgi:hypothetical protein
VAHLSDGALRRMFDDPNAMTAPDREHYSTCTECRSRHDALAGDARAAAALIAVPAATFDAEAAFKRITAQPEAKPRFGIRLPILQPRTQGTVAVLAAVVVLAVVATASANVLQIFTPKTVEPVPVTVAELQTLPDLSAWGTVTWSQEPQPQIVVDAASAAKIAGFQPPATGTLPEGVSTTVTYAAMPQATGVFTFSAAKAAAAAAAKGKTLPRMPAGMDGSSLTLTMGPALVEIYGNLGTGSSTDSSQLNLPQLIVAESKAPVVSSSGVTVKQLEDYLLEQPGISAQLAAQIRAIGDPTTTLPIPVPIQFATSTTVKVQGVQGVALGDNTGLGSAVIWIKDGQVFLIGGTLKQSEVISIANELH